MLLIIYETHIDLRENYSRPVNLPDSGLSSRQLRADIGAAANQNGTGMKQFSRWLTTFACLLGGLSLPVSSAYALDAVTLQLKWTHAFQFAGYYAAKELGYYREAGLDVRINEALPGSDPVKTVLDGKAEFGVGTSALLLERKAGKPVVALAVIFQHSPYVLITRQQNAIQTIHDIIGMRVMLEPQADELQAYLKQEGISLNRITRLEHSYDPQDLIDGKTDAIAAYVTNQPYYLDRANFAYQVYTPRSSGIDFYGDNLFTTEQELRVHPERVKAFRAASLLGWQYAMEHPEEIIDLILAKYSKRHTRDYYLFEAKQMISLLHPELVEIGYMYPGRWRHMAETYADIGMLPRNFSLKGFLYDPNPKLDLTWLYRSLAAALLLIGVIGAVALYIARNNRRLAHSLAERKRAGEVLQQKHEKLLETERELLKAYELLAEVDRLESAGRLAAGVAHEVKNPLTIIRLGVDYLSEQFSQESNKEVLDDVRGAIDRADNVIKDLLDISRQQPLVRRPININQVIDNAIRLIKHKIERRNIAIVRSRNDPMPLIYADPDRLVQVFINLLSNAAQAIGQDGNIEIVTRSICLSERDLELSGMSMFRVGEQVVAVEIRDNGPGFPTEYEKKLFEPFFTTKPMGEGSGLGLAVSRGIVIMHGGSISISNRPEGGASALLMFRVYREHLKNE